MKTYTSPASFEYFEQRIKTLESELRTLQKIASMGLRSIPPDSVDSSKVLDASLLGTDLAAGTLADREIGGLSTTRLSGQVQDNQVASLTATKLLGQLAYAAIPALGAGQLVTGAATNSIGNAATTSDPSAPASLATVPEMAVNLTVTGGWCLMAFSTTIWSDTGGVVDFVLNDGSADIGHTYRRINIVAGYSAVDVTAFHAPGAAARTFSVRWMKVSGGTIRCNGAQRSFGVVEFRR